MLPAAVESWDSYYSNRYRYSYYSNSTGTGSIVEDSCYTSRQKDVAPPYSYSKDTPGCKADATKQDRTSDLSVWTYALYSHSCR